MDSVVSYFGKDIASIIYQCLFQLHMQDINKQYREFLSQDSAAGVSFFNVDLPAFTVKLNWRCPFSNDYIMHCRFHDNKGWYYVYCGPPPPRKYW